MKSNSGLMKTIQVLMKANLMTSLMFPIMTLLWDFVNVLFVFFGCSIVDLDGSFYSCIDGFTVGS